MADPVATPRLSEAAIAQYHAEGFLRIPSVLDAATVEAMYPEVLEAAGAYEGSKLQQSSRYLAGSTIDGVVNSPALRSLAETLLGGPASLYLPFTAVKGSGGGQFHFHQDNNYTHFDGPGINLWLALMDMGPEHGCLMVIPRSHLSGTLASENAGDGDSHRKVTYLPGDFVAVPLQAGDGLAFGRLTVHGSGPNTSPGPRVGYAVQYFRNDTTFLDRASGEHKLLLEHSPQRDHTRPVSRFV